MGATLAARVALALVALIVAGVRAGSNTYYGRLIGSLDSPFHALRGDVYAVDARTLFIKGFSYDGQGQDTVFLGGSSSKSGAEGFVIPNESGSTEKLSKSYDNQDLTLTLPEGKTLKEVRWMTLFSRADSENLAEVKVPSGFDYPRPQRLNALSGIHKVSSDRVYVVDAQTFLIPNFTYDGTAPDAFFWVGQGNRPGQNGIKVPDENGKGEPLRQYDSKTLVLTLPGDLTVFDVDWISIWCKAFDIDFAHIRIPKNLNVPPSLKMLGVAPQSVDEDGDSALFSFPFANSATLPSTSLNNDVSASRQLSPTARRRNRINQRVRNAQASTQSAPSQSSSARAARYAAPAHLPLPIPLLRTVP